jgi:acetyl-CoA carboxylase biotin carboxyl carrier protein
VLNGTGAPVSEAASAGAVPPVTELVTLLTERALALAVRAPGAPSSVRIAANAVEVEICWPTGPVAPAPAAPAAPAAAAVALAAPADAGQPGTFPLLASMVGTFYRAPEPGAAPFVSEGDQVRPGQQVGIIEAMKLMVPVEAERAGEVAEFLVTDREPVEYGQPLLLLRGASQ